MLNLSYIVILLVVFLMNSDVRFLFLQVFMILTYLLLQFSFGGLSSWAYLLVMFASVVVFNLLVWLHSISLEIVYTLILLICSMFSLLHVGSVLELLVIVEIVSFALLAQLSSLNIFSVLHFYILNFLGGIALALYYCYCVVYCHGASLGLVLSVLVSEPSRALYSIVVFWLGVKMYIMPFGLWIFNFYYALSFDVLFLVTVQVVMVFWWLFFDVLGTGFVSSVVPCMYMFLVLTVLGVFVTSSEANIRVFSGLSSMMQAGFMLAMFGMSGEWMSFVFSWYIVLYGFNMLGMFILFSRVLDNIRFIDLRFQGLFSLDSMTGLSIILVIFSVAGLPVGFLFLNKFFLFQVFKTILGLLFLMIMASFVVAILYYFRFIKSVLFSDIPDAGWLQLSSDYLVGRILFLLLYLLY